MKITNNIVIEKAKSLGFDLVGFAKAEKLEEEILKLESWLQRGYNAGMTYMEHNLNKRKDVNEILSGAKSIITLAVNYYTDEKCSGDPKNGKISRYAWGTDYHLIIWDKLSKLETQLHEIDPDFYSKSYVDTGPVMDKVWAVKSGLGWMGKHSNIINRELGSWLFLSSIITNYEFGYSNPVPDFCGSCTACIDVCPTDSIVSEYVVDANKCISYLTIENKEEIPAVFSEKFENWIFGCDICQDVCPWNIKFSELTDIKEFYPGTGNTEISLKEVFTMDEETFKKKYKLSPIKRTKLQGLKRNAKFLQANLLMEEK